MADWYEELPDRCPPAEAAPPPEGKAFFRLVAEIPPTEADFVPLGRLHPARTFAATAACRAMAISLHDSEAASRALLKLPTQKGKEIVEIALTTDAGALAQTGARRSHHSWWRSRNFDALSAARQIA